MSDESDVAKCEAESADDNATAEPDCDDTVRRKRPKWRKQTMTRDKIEEAQSR